MKAIILDMYGVILQETGDGFFPFVNSVSPELSTEEIFRVWDRADMGEIPSLEVFRHLGFKGDLPKIERDYLNTIEINEAFYKFASQVKKTCKLALISNDSIEWSKYLRGKFQLDAFFDVISVSGDLKIKKPDHRIFNHTLDKLGCRSADCTFIDDRCFNLEAAESLGIKTILFNSRNVRYEGTSVNNFEELSGLLFC
jgi:putative hydrolase of the HAD superfamily